VAGRDDEAVATLAQEAAGEKRGEDFCRRERLSQVAKPLDRDHLDRVQPCPRGDPL
jgi:hypothetical protein